MDIESYTPRVHAHTNASVTLMFTCGKDLSIRAIIVMPTFLALRSVVMDLQANVLYMRN